jgi:hypothetical protein
MKVDVRAGGPKPLASPTARAKLHVGALAIELLAYTGRRSS